MTSRTRLAAALLGLAVLRPSARAETRPTDTFLDESRGRWEELARRWAQTSCAAHPVGYKGMLVAAKVLAASEVDMLGDPAAVQSAKDDFAAQTRGRPYVSPLPPEAKPPPH